MCVRLLRSDPRHTDFSRFCQGLSLASSGTQENRHFPLVVFDSEDDNDPIRRITNLQLSDELMGGSETANPYFNPHNSFHISFYKKLPGLNVNGLVQESKGKGLKIGRLYKKPWLDCGSKNNTSNGLAFRKSSFTVSSC